MGATAFVIIFFAFIFMIIGIAGLSGGGNAIGIFFIVLSVTSFTLTIAYIFYRKIKYQQMIKEFEDWLTQNDFVYRRVTDEFLIDDAHKKWCKFLEKSIFDIAEIQKLEIAQSTKKQTTSRRTSYGSTYRGFWRNSKRRNNSSNRVSETVTLKEYEVIITTNNIHYPVISLYCGRSYEDAKKIENTIKIIKAEI